jgi:hypothetical protein
LILTPSGSVGSDVTLTLPASTATLATVSQIQGPTFSVTKSANQSISGSTWTKVTFDTEGFDTGNYFDTSTSRFTPLVAGYYQVNGAAWMGGQPQQRVSVYRNGTEYKTGPVTANGGGYMNSSNVVCIVYLNGSTDYIELYVYQAGGSQTIDRTATDTYFQGVLVRTA